MKREEQILKRLTEQEGGLFYDTALRAMREFAKKDLLPPAEGAEQLIRVRNILQDFYRRGDYELEQAAEDIMRIFPQQPTAEGAEEIRREYSEESLDFFRSFIKARKELCAISPTETYSLEEAIRKAFDGFFPKPLSVIDDAETILHSHPYLKVWMENVGDSEMKVCNIEQALWAIEKAATLHAQKIADKMVSERLREELIKYEIHWNFVLRDNAEKVVDEYLKSRESHDNIR